MADFTQIIQEINDDINTNGVGSITGAKLNEVLRDMIAAVNAAKQDPLTIDATPTDDSTNPVQSGGVYDALQDKVDKVQLATTNDIATLGANGNIKDSGVSIGSVAMDAAVVHKSGDETISGEKTFSDKTIFNNEIKLIDDNEIGAKFYSSEEGKIEFYGSPSSGTVQLKHITSPSASSDAATKGYVDGEIAGKQDTISDLATIRSGAAAGATAVQPSDLATVATSGSYNDLLNKPTIPAAQVQSDWNEADNTKVDYIKNKPTIPDVSGKADKVVGATSGDVATLDSTGNLTDSGLSVFDFFIMVEDATTPPASMAPNNVYKYGTLSGNTTFPPLATPTEPDIANVYCWTFTTPATAPTITWPIGITAWAGGSAPTINASKSYEVSVMDGFATIIEN